VGTGGFAAQLWYSSSVLRRVAIIFLLVLVCVLSYISVALRVPGAPVAPWWPAAGIGAIAVLASRGSRLGVSLGIVFVALMANVFAGREVGLTVGYAIANAIELYIFAAFVTRGGPQARLESLRDVSRFIVAAGLGTLAAGVIAGATAALTVDAPFLRTAFSVVASHFSALVVIVPIALVTRRMHRSRNPLEVILQSLTLLALMLVVFWPGDSLPIVFLPLVALLWAAFRLPMALVAIELIVVATLAILLTGVGGGAIGVYVATEPRTAQVLLQLFLVVHACAALFVSGARNDWATAVTQLGARESLLRGGIVNAESGILIAEVIDGERLRVVGVNPAALDVLGRETMPPTWGTGGLRISPHAAILGVAELDESIRQRKSTRLVITRGERRFDVDVGITDGAEGSSVVTMVFTDVTTRVERERKALEAAEQLRDLNRQKDDFIASVSHELRTPVTSILGFAEDLELSPLGSEDRVATEVIARNARRLADVIEDLLELGSASVDNSDGVALRPASEFDIVALTRHCAQDAEGLAVGRSIRLTVSAPDTALMIRSVSQDVARVLANLLSNAVKFSPRDSTVDITVASSDSGVTIAIADHGPGIPPAVLSEVWGRFYRVSSPRHRDVPGTGLGLPIVEALTQQRLRGRVALLSDGETGTTAVLSLPWDRDDAPGGADSDREVDGRAEPAQLGL
jgi:two-component system, OmpR family, phosphate regulon sensor histidine kinase PhoR